MPRIVIVFLLGFVAGCGDDTGTTPIPPPSNSQPACAPGELMLDDGSCRAAGLPPDLPPAGPETPPQAGVPAGSCHEGFASDGEGGCNPILPAEPCANGTIAVPGDTVCREIAACGAAPWGDIPLDSGAEFVDAAFAGQSDGSAAFPWKTLQEAADAAAPGDMVAIAAGSYSGSISLGDKPVRLWGRCPALVEIVGVAGDAAIDISIAGVELHTLAVTGIGTGVDVHAPGGAVLDRLWIHDQDGPGIMLRGGSETTDIHGSLIERVVYTGVVAEAARFRFERSETRDPYVLPDGTTGMGIHIVADGVTNLPSDAYVSGSHVHGNTDVGIAVALSSLELVGTAVRDTHPTEPGWGVGLLAVGEPVPATVSVEGSVFSAHTSYGIAIDASSGTIATTTIEDTLVHPNVAYAQGLYVNASDVDVIESVVRDSAGMGMQAFASNVRLTRTLVQRVTPSSFGDQVYNAAVGAFDAGVPSVLEIEECIIEQGVENGLLVVGSDVSVGGSIVRDIDHTPTFPYAAGVLALPSQDIPREARVIFDHSLLERNSGSGIAMVGGDVTFRASVVRDTLLSGAGDYGLGLLLVDAEDRPTKATVQGSVIERAHDRGIQVLGSELDMEATVVRGVEPAPTGGSGRGIELTKSDTGRRSIGAIRWSVVEDVNEAALFVWSSEVDVRGVLFRNVEAAPPDTGYGIAIVAGPDSQKDPSHVIIAGSHIEHTHTAGIGIDGSQVEVTGTLVRDIQTSALDDRMGYCAFAQRGATLEVADSLMERCASAGIGFQRSTGTVRNTTVRDIRANGIDLLGDGVVVIAGEVTLGPLLVERVARAAVSSFGAHIALHDATLLCSAIDIDVETTSESSPFIDDLGENRCGCPTADRPCEAVSAGLTAPEPVAPPPE